MNNFYQKTSDETNEEFLERILKVKYKNNLTWEEISDIINSAIGSNLSADACRKRAHRLINKIDYNTEEKYEAIADKVKYQDENTTINAMYRRMAREDTLKEIAHDVVTNMNAKLELEYIPPRFNSSMISNSGVLLISDWHYGIDIENFFNQYNPDIAKKRISDLLYKVIEYGEKEHITELYVLNLGDMIAGNIHLPIRLNSRRDVISQIIEVSELIAQFLNSLSNKFKVHYASCIDNHSRIDPNKKEQLQLESLTRITDWYLKERLPQIEFEENIFGVDITQVAVEGLNIVAVHGDKDKQKSMIKNLSAYTKIHWDIICSAHMHHFSCDEDNRTMRISNGSLMGTDQFAHDLRLDSDPSQTLLVISPEVGLKNIFKINLA